MTCTTRPRSGPSATTVQGWPSTAGTTRGTGSSAGHGLDVLQHPDLNADHPGVGPQVRELHHVALLAAGPEQEVVVGLAGQALELVLEPAAQPEASPDGVGGLGRGHGDRRRQPGHVQEGITGTVTARGDIVRDHITGLSGTPPITGSQVNAAGQHGQARRPVQLGEGPPRHPHDTHPLVREHPREEVAANQSSRPSSGKPCMFWAARAARAAPAYRPRAVPPWPGPGPTPHQSSSVSSVSGVTPLKLPSPGVE
jgi:hypothetical protein